MTNLRIPFLTLTALAVLLLSCGCSPQQEKLGPCPNEFESHTPIYDRDTILFHYESFNHEAIDEIPPTPEGSGGGVIAIGDKIECRFLYDSNSEIIDPGKSGYIRIVDSGPAS